MNLINKQTRIRIIEVSSILFAILFLYTGVSKLLDFENFQLELQKSPLLSDYYRVVSIGIPVAEILVAFGMLWIKTRFIALIIFLFFMTLFTSYIYTILNFTGYIPCSCGGVIESLGWTEHLIFNAVFIAMAIYSILIYPAKDINNERNFIAQ